jgi:hypothetical protein
MREQLSLHGNLVGFRPRKVIARTLHLREIAAAYAAPGVCRARLMWSPAGLGTANVRKSFRNIYSEKANFMLGCLACDFRPTGRARGCGGSSGHARRPGATVPRSGFLLPREEQFWRPRRNEAHIRRRLGNAMIKWFDIWLKASEFMALFLSPAITEPLAGVGLRGRKYLEMKNRARTPRNPLKSHKTAKGIFGKACKFQGNVWRRAWKNFRPTVGFRLGGEGKKLS